jgi:hypothetical protein
MIVSNKIEARKIEAKKIASTMIASKRTLVGACAVVLGLAAPLWAQSADSLLPPVAATTGKLVFTFTITATSGVPKNGIVTCNATANVNEASSGQNIFQKATGVATLNAAGKWICKAIMPYSWVLATPASDNVILAYDVEVDYGFEITASNGTGTVVVPLSTDKVNQNLGSISVPLNGSTTNETVSVTI